MRGRSSIRPQGEKKNLTEMLDILTNSKDAAVRDEVQKAVNDGLGGYFAKYSAQTLYVIVGRGAVERKERHYRSPMESRNKENRIPDAVVDALHNAVKNVAGPLARRYYRLKAGLLGMKTLRWSDRNAPLPFTDTTVVPYDNAISTVLAAYESFSPTLTGIIQRSLHPSISTFLRPQANAAELLIVPLSFPETGRNPSRS